MSKEKARAIQDEHVAAIRIVRAMWPYKQSARVRIFAMVALHLDIISAEDLSAILRDYVADELQKTLKPEGPPQ